MSKGYAASLLREDPGGGWSELQGTSTVTVHRSSIMVRSATGSLQADFPVQSLSSLALVDNQLLRLTTTTHGARFALRLTAQDMPKLCADLRNGAGQYPPFVACTSKSQSPLGLVSPMSFPSAEDPALHELVAALLYKPEFQDFVDSVATVLDSMHTTMSKK